MSTNPSQKLKDDGVVAPTGLAELLVKYEHDNEALRVEMERSFPGISFHYLENNDDFACHLGDKFVDHPREVAFGPRHPRNFGDTWPASDHSSIYMDYASNGNMKALEYLCSNNLPVFRSNKDKKALTRASSLCMDQILRNDIMRIRKIHVLGGSCRDLCRMHHFVQKYSRCSLAELEIVIYTSEDNFSFTTIDELSQRIASEKHFARTTIVKIASSKQAYIDTYLRIRENADADELLYSDCVMHYLYADCTAEEFDRMNIKPSCTELHFAPISNHGKSNEFLDSDSEYVVNSEFLDNGKKYLHCALGSGENEKNWEDPIIPFEKLSKLLLPTVGALQIYNSFSNFSKTTAYAGSISKYLSGFCFIYSNLDDSNFSYRERPAIAMPLRFESVFELSHKPVLYQEKKDGLAAIFELSEGGLFVKKADGSERFLLTDLVGFSPLPNTSFATYDREQFELLVEFDPGNCENNHFINGLIYKLDFEHYVCEIARKVVSSQVLTRNGNGVMLFQEPYLRAQYTHVILNNLQLTRVKFRNNVRSKKTYLNFSNNFLKRIEDFDEGVVLMDPMSYTTSIGSITYVKRSYTDDIYLGKKTFNIFGRKKDKINELILQAKSHFPVADVNSGASYYAHDSGEVHFLQVTLDAHKEVTKDGGRVRFRVDKLRQNNSVAPADCATWGQMRNFSKQKALYQSLNTDSISSSTIRDFEAKVQIYLSEGKISIFENDVLYNLFSANIHPLLKYDENFPRMLRVSKCLQQFRKVVTRSKHLPIVPNYDVDEYYDIFYADNYLGEVDGIIYDDGVCDNDHFDIEIVPDTDELTDKSEFSEFLNGKRNFTTVYDPPIEPTDFPDAHYGPKKRIVVVQDHHHISSTKQLVNCLRGLESFLDQRVSVLHWPYRIRLNGWDLLQEIVNAKRENLGECVAYIKTQLASGNIWLLNGKRDDPVPIFLKFQVQ